MPFQLAVGGILPESDHIVAQIKTSIDSINSKLPNDGVQLLVAPSYTSAEWKPFIGGFDTFGFLMNADPDWSDVCAHSVWQDTPLRSVVGEAMSDRADLVIMVWNEDVTEFNGASWELIQIAHKEKTPCLWISSKTGSVYWSETSYFEKFEDSCIEDLCSGYLDCRTEPFDDNDKKIPVISLGIALRKRFLGKFKAYKPETEPVSDRILCDDFSFDNEERGSEKVRKLILEQFKKFDRSAVKLNTQYQAVIYWRAILPFIATLFLAVGFYAETLLNVRAFHVGSIARSYIAGTGFLIHGLIYLYVFFLSKNRIIKSKHDGFLRDRYTAEILRILIHFVPYGIYTDIRGVCDNNISTRAAIQKMTIASEPELQKVDKKSTSLILEHVREMIEDQISYHRASADRYDRITKRLDKCYRCLFAVGLTTIILRAVFQFAVPFLSINNSALAHYIDVNNLLGTDLQSYIRSFANMAALLLPAWATYFNTKASLCNFRFNRENHLRMEEKLVNMLGHIEAAQNVDGDIPIDILNTVSEELARIMIVEDTLIWEGKYKSSTVEAL